MHEPIRAHHPPDFHAAEPAITPAAIVPATERPVVWVPDAYGRGMVPITRDLAPPLPAATPPRDLSPVPLIHPRAQILAAGGVGVGAAGWGIGQLLNALAAVGSGALLALVLLVIAARAPRAGRGGETHIHITNNHNRWWGKSTTNL